MKTLLSIAAAAAIGFGGAAAAAPIKVDFSSFNAGDIVGTLAGKDFTFGPGLTGKIKVDNNDAPDIGMIFDTDNITGGDTDLKSPFESVQGLGPLFAGKVLIISEDGNTSKPDDEQKGGVITFLFDRLVNFVSIDVLDTEEGSNRALISSDLGFLSAAIFSGDRKYNRFTSTDAKLQGISSLTVDFGGSGALDNLTVVPVPVPAALPLMVMALGALGVAARRRRA
jgi:hypothetical protein